MKVFFDTNVWIASFIAQGLCAQLVRAALALHDTGRVEVLTCPAVLEETQRLLRNRFRASDAQLAASQTIFQSIHRIADGATPIPVDFPDQNDWPILAAALAVQTDLFVTGDKALLALTEVEGLPILDPRTAYLKLRSLE